MIQGVHHDNYDLWKSKYQPWNSVNISPKRDLLREWVNACHKYHMRYGVTFHHEYTWRRIGQPSYPNWDGLDGHVGGHYLSALAINAITGNEHGGMNEVLADAYAIFACCEVSFSVLNIQKTLRTLFGAKRFFRMY